MRFVKFSIVAFLLSILSACTLVPGGEVFISAADKKLSNQTPSITVEQIEFQKITAQNTRGIAVKARKPYRNFKLEQQVKNYSYKVGAGDVLTIIVWEHPELLNLGTRESVIPVKGFQIDSKGFIFYPFVGNYQVAGKTIFAIRKGLGEALKKYVKQPQLDVSVLKYASQKIHLTGQFARPLPIPLQGQAITLLDAVNLAGGATPRANLSDVVVIRKGQRRIIDLYALLHFGDMRQNILLRDGDQIHVPSQKPKYAYVMGQVASPQPVPITPEGVTLAEALGKARGINEITANASAVYVIRDSKMAGKVAKVYLLDLSNMAAMVLASKFELKSEDVVYVSKSPIVKWNQLLSVVRPSLTSTREIISTQAAVGAAF